MPPNMVGLFEAGSQQSSAACCLPLIMLALLMFAVIYSSGRKG